MPYWVSYSTSSAALPPEVFISLSKSKRLELGELLDRWRIVLMADHAPLAAYLTIPDFGAIIQNTESNTLGIVYLFGVLWGIGGLTYGLGVRYLGVSLVAASSWDSVWYSGPSFLPSTMILVPLKAKTLSARCIQATGEWWY